MHLIVLRENINFFPKMSNLAPSKNACLCVFCQVRFSKQLVAFHPVLKQQLAENRGWGVGVDIAAKQHTRQSSPRESELPILLHFAQKLWELLKPYNDAFGEVMLCLYTAGIQ